jgi:hypothetical protein
VIVQYWPTGPGNPAGHSGIGLQALRFSAVWYPITGMKYGYARVSTEDPNDAAELLSLWRAGCKAVLTDERNTPMSKRPALRRCINSLRRGDTLIVWKFDGLADNSRDLRATIEGLARRGVKCLSLTEEPVTTLRLKQGRRVKLPVTQDAQELTGWPDYRGWLTA